MYVCESVCETDIVKGISLRRERALKSVGHVNLLCPNCFPLLTWLVIMPFSHTHTHARTPSNTHTHTHTVAHTPTHFLPHSAVTTLSIMPNRNLPKTQQADRIRPEK